MASVGDRLRQITQEFRKEEGLPKILLSDELTLWPQGRGESVLSSRVDLIHLCPKCEEELNIEGFFDVALKAETFGDMVSTVSELCREQHTAIRPEVIVAQGGHND